ncbi:transformer-2 protein homolog alpha isoform X1 [Osmia bicornis bicornis]|uniref:transformer-2 protein homolog alpha isoform X1 n=1 Tax=Osmia bicornis bicornis TaxID=1437191 RepID=UPI0010F5086D|nr:transformer-2 protein homolog alpha isoform X1 [Osmia bicornis bicornis]
MSDIERSGSRSASPRRPRTADGGLRDSRSHSRSRKSRERKESHRPVKEYSRSRSRSVSRGRKSYRSSKYASAGHRGSSRSRSRTPYRGGRYSRSRSRSYSRSRYSRERDRNIYRSHSRSPMSSRRRHVGNRDNPNPSRCLGVFGLSIFTTEQQIYHIFSKHGPVERVQVVFDAKTGRSRGFCFVYFESAEDAKVAREQCTGMEIDGRRIRVAFSITQRAHTPTPGIYMGKPTHLHDRGWDGPRRRESSYRGSYRRSPSPYYSRRRSRYDRSRSRSYSPRKFAFSSSIKSNISSLHGYVSPLK